MSRRRTRVARPCPADSRPADRALGLPRAAQRSDRYRSRDTVRAHHPAEASFATAAVERRAKALAGDAREHRGVEHMLAAPIAALADGCDPGLRRRIPAGAHG